MGRMIAMEQGLSPYSFQIGFETLTVIRVGEGESDSASDGSSRLPAEKDRVIVYTR
jgi:polyribonucleotide 5'-hydroxyl-kinase